MEGRIMERVVGLDPRAQGERQWNFEGGNQGVKIISERAISSSNQEIQVCKGSTCFSRSLLDRSQEKLRVFWHERGATPSSGKLTRQFQIFRPQRCQIDGQMRPRLGIGLQRLALTPWQRQLIDLAVVAQTFTAKDHAHNLDHFACALQRVSKTHAMPSLHHLWPTHPQTQDKTILG